MSSSLVYCEILGVKGTLHPSLVEQNILFPSSVIGIEDLYTNFLL